MKYLIEISGRGGEIVIGTVAREIYDYFEEHGIEIEEYASDWDNEQDVPDEFQPFEPGSWYDCDDLLHNCGPCVDDAYITVTDSNGDYVHDAVTFAAMIDLGTEYEEVDEVYPHNDLAAGEAYFIGQSFEKGSFLSYEVDAEVFDPAKFVLNTADCDGWELIVGAKYDGVDLEDLGELSTMGKGAEFQLVLVEEDEDDG